MTAQLQFRREAGRDLGILVWRWPLPMLAIASGPLGGGIGPLHWAVNAQVPGDYARHDPDRHLARLATDLGLTGPGSGMLTAADVTERQAAQRAGVHVTASVGLGLPLLAAAPDHCQGQEHPRPGEHAHAADHAVAGRGPAAPAAGTINIVAIMPARLSQAALVNAVITVTEAKTQALMAAGIEATGTATDAVCVACPAAGPAEPFCGPRSWLGAPLARAVHAAVHAGAASWLARTSP